LLGKTVLHMEYSFFVGGGLACAMTGVLWDMRIQAEYSLLMLAVVLFFYGHKISW
jgi:hypothetical protein